MNKSDWQENLTLSAHSQRKGFGQSVNPAGSLDIRVRVRMIWVMFVVGMALLGAKILYLQVITRGQYQLMAYTNHIELVREVAERGTIYDRQGVALSLNTEIEGVMTREYPLAQAVAPVVGYLSEVRSEEIGCFEGLCYLSGMWVGRTGIEKVMEARLRGRDGGRMVEVDATGKEVRELGKNDPEKGTDIVLSIDARLQEIMYRFLGEYSGSAVALDMQGKVLGLVSKPTYDPNHPSDYLSDTTKLYFVNRAISGTYPPGSVFKLVTSLAGLAEGKISGESEYEDTGEIKVGEYRYGNWYFDQYGRTEGSINVVKALARSNDVYYYRLGEAVGVDRLVAWARKFGLGDTTGIELPGEASGLVPDRLWKERITGEQWFLGNTYHLSIGQGDLLTTPLQVARMSLAGISGRVCQVSMLKDTPAKCPDLGLKTEHLELIKAGMKAACAPGGTAFPFFEFAPSVICKTGTAQHSGQREEGDLPHAWITVGYPGDNPEMILVVMLESGGEGSAQAGGVAKMILEEWGKL